MELTKYTVMKLCYMEVINYYKSVVEKHLRGLEL